MPKQFQDFLITDTYTIDQLKIDAVIPDAIDHDNLTQNAEIHHAHSFKMEETKNGKGEIYLKWLDGDVLERLKGISADIHDFYAEGKLDMVRYSFGKNSHYRIDALTPPHLHRGKPFSLHHTEFETDMGKFITKHKDEIGNFEFHPYKDIYKDCRRTAETMWHKGLEIVDILEKGEKISDEVKLDICRICVQEVGNLWTTLGSELKIT